MAGQKKTPEAQNEYINESQLCMLVGALQPPRPTCATCEYCNDVVKWGELEFQCRNQNVPGNAADRNMGCIHHSDYDEVKECLTNAKTAA